jgi:citrate lyase subunit beta/citryl-CoA lyase
MSLTPLRSLLFVPGDRPDRVEKALRAGADAVIIDLEDAVAQDKKAEARSLVRQKLLDHEQEVLFVRVNSLASGLMAADLEQVLVSSLRCIVAPMISSADELREACSLISETERRKGVAIGSVALIPLFETASAVELAFEIATARIAVPRLVTVAFGAADFTLDMQIEMTPEGTELWYARSRIAVACRAAGLEAPLDTPYMLDIRDSVGLKRDAERARQLGFQGKLCIHPVQVPVCNELFMPGAKEVEQAKKILEIFGEAEAHGVASIQVDGKFVDYPVAARARRIVELAERVRSERVGRQAT